MKFIVLILFILIAFQAKSRELLNIQRSPRAILMGNAYSSIATDEYTLFYNPATLARHSGFSLYPLNMMLTATNPLDDMDRFEENDEISSDPNGFVGQFTDFPVHLGAAYTPGFKMGHFGLSIINNTYSNMTLLNNIHPLLDIQHKRDRGFVMGYGLELGNNFHFGFSIKYLKRKGLEDTFPVYSTRIIDIIESEPDAVSDILDALGQEEGRGWGGDLGIEYVVGGMGTQIVWALTAMDVGDTRLRKSGGTRAAVPEQKMNITTGLSFSQDYKIFDYTLSADISRINQRVDNGRRLHLGAEVGTPVFRFLGGYSEGYLSYGAQLNFGILDIYAGLYETEIGSGYKQKKAKRGLIYLSLLDFHFDV